MTTFTTYDGRTVFTRRINRDDSARLVDMFYRSSEHTRQMRFHCGCKTPSDELVWREAAKLSLLDPQRQVALGACIHEDNGDRIVGVARFGRVNPDDQVAETGVIVRDDFQGVGLGTHLLFSLAEAAQSMGILYLSAWILPENHKVLHLIKKIGTPVKQIRQHGEIYIEVLLEDVKVSREC